MSGRGRYSKEGYKGIGERIKQYQPGAEPTPATIEEIEGAKKRGRKKRKKGRYANILAGRLMTKRSQILKTNFGE